MGGLANGPVSVLNGYPKELYEMSMAFGVRQKVNLLQAACTSMCHHKYTIVTELLLSF